MGSENPGSYILKFHGGEFPLDPSEWSLDAGLEYVVPFSGDILWQKPDAEDEPTADESLSEDVLFGDLLSDEAEPQIVGRFQGFVIEATRALNDGVDLWDHCDAHSQDMYDYATTFYDAEGTLKESLEDEFEAPWTGQDLLIIDEIALAPAHRGRLVGLRILRRLTELRGRGCGLAATMPFPLQFHDRGEDTSDFDLHPERNRKRAERKLARYLERLGFLPLPESSMYAVSMSFELPSLKERPPEPRRPEASRAEPGRPGKVLPFVLRGDSGLDKPAS